MIGMHNVNKDYVRVAEAYVNRIRWSKAYTDYMQKMLLGAAVKKDPLVRDILKENEELRNKYKGKRCFILGNGPSLNDIDFSILKDEVVFTVNQLSEHSHFKDLNSNFHIITDVQAFGLRYDEEEGLPGFAKYSLELMRGLYEQGNPVFIVPYEVKRIVERERIPEKLTVKYVYLSREKFIQGYQHCDLTIPMPDFSCVVHTAILCAIYMGFSQIYLLGCDQTSIIDILECGLHRPVRYGHAQENDREKSDIRWYRNDIESRSISTYLYSEFQTHEGYKALYEFARKKRVKMLNLSSSTLIDCIPRGNIKDILIEKE